MPGRSTARSTTRGRSTTCSRDARSISPSDSCPSALPESNRSRASTAMRSCKLNQIRGNSYCHLFAFVEEYIVPMVLENATRDVYGDETRLWSLLRFAEEEVKHQEMMRQACDQFADGLRHAVRAHRRPGGRRAGRAEYVAPHRIAADELDRVVRPAALRRARPRQPRPRPTVPRPAPLPLDRRVPTRQARFAADRRGRVRSRPRPSASRRSTNSSQLGTAIDGLLAQQLELDIDALERAASRTFTADERDEIRTAQHRAYRWTFLVSGLEHPKFLEIVEALTRKGRAKLDAAVQALSA